MTRGALQHFFKTGPSLTQAAQSEQGYSEMDSGVNIVWLQLQSASQPNFRVGAVPLRPERNSKITMCFRINRVDLDRLTKTLFRLRKQAHLAIHRSQIVYGIGVAGIEFNQLLKKGGRVGIIAPSKGFLALAQKMLGIGRGGPIR